jgi:hypothetical protein
LGIRDPTMLPLQERREVRKRGRSVTRTIRLDEDIGFQLDATAERERQSGNIIISKALRGYLEWTQYAKLLNHATVSHTLLEKMMDYLTVDEARELGRWSATNTLVEMTNMLFGGVRLTSTIATLAIMAKYSGRFVLEHTFENPKHYLILIHDAGFKWSQFYEEYLITAIQNSQVKQFDVKITDNQVAFFIEEPGLTSGIVTETPLRERRADRTRTREDES